MSLFDTASSCANNSRITTDCPPSRPKRVAGEPALGGPPGRAAPVAPPDAGNVHVDWDYRFGGDIYHCTTTLEIGAGDGPVDILNLEAVA